jgi:tRNA (cytidine/uridine-2'-O-)-methyltransferase
MHGFNGEYVARATGFLRKRAVYPKLRQINKGEKTMFHIVLYEPEIPPNTGNVIRLAANIGAKLHLIRPLGFDLDHAKLRRAGLDYHEFTSLTAHDNFAHFLAAVTPNRVFALTTKGARRFTEPGFLPGDAFVFGPETRGLPAEFIAVLPPNQRLVIPMTPGGRSLNLSNAVAVVAFEAWRQIGFIGAKA